MSVFLLALQRKAKPLRPWCIAAMLISLVGLLLLAGNIYWHPDAQNAIGVVLTPILQGIAFLVTAPLAWWAGGRYPVAI